MKTTSDGQKRDAPAAKKDDSRVAPEVIARRARHGNVDRSAPPPDIHPRG